MCCAACCAVPPAMAVCWESTDTFLADVANTVIDENKNAYPELDGEASDDYKADPCGGGELCQDH